ncbi:MAG: succinate dehydrogenase cytochrome b subunit [Planctomycetota bacterium]|jgi:succinate dehydrogenase / fumarate reductase cytochrome b subunit
MTSLLTRLDTSLGRKLVVALTGLGLLGFVLGHLAGNLQIFLGQDAINAYAVTLKELGPLLWVMRFGLIAIALVHVILTLQLAAANRAARPVRYRGSGSVQITPAARGMTLTGLVILAFVAFHLAHLTWGLTHPEHYALRDADGRQDVYSMMVLAFQQPLLSGLYMAAVLLLGLHLVHGISSFFQTLGWDHPRLHVFTQAIGPILGTLIALGYVAIPSAVLLGYVSLPPGAGP